MVNTISDGGQYKQYRKERNRIVFKTGAKLRNTAMQFQV